MWQVASEDFLPLAPSCSRLDTILGLLEASARDWGRFYVVTVPEPDAPKGHLRLMEAPCRSYYRWRCRRRRDVRYREFSSNRVAAQGDTKQCAHFSRQTTVI